MLSDFEIRRLINHVDRRWKEISLTEDKDLRMKEKTEFLEKMGEILESLSKTLESSRRDRPECHPFGPGG